MNKQLKEKSKLGLLQQKFNSLQMPEQIIFIRRVMTPELKREIFFSTMKKIRNAFQKNFSGQEREELIRESLAYARKKDHVTGRN